MMNLHRRYGMFGGFDLLEIIVIGLGILLVLLGIYLFGKYFNEKKDPSNQSNRKSNRALEILDERYAMGEIDENEFKKMKQNLLED